MEPSDHPVQFLYSVMDGENTMIVDIDLPGSDDSPGFYRAEKDGCEDFIRLIYGYYQENRRSMPWRDNISPYHVVVSEIMLQQTRVGRVLEKFPQFIQRFPDFSALSSAALGEVIEEWQGLGYNRRAKYLHALARQVVEGWGGDLPGTREELLKLPGIGKATAGSVIAFAFNKPVVFIETNIRRVFIHHFFRGYGPVSDDQIMPMVAMTLDRQNPREWYYALMDYGTWLAGRIENPNRRSRHYSKQSAFEGSDRQVRGRMIRLLIEEKSCVADHLIAEAEEPHRGEQILSKLIKEGLVCESDGFVRFAEKPS